MLFPDCALPLSISRKICKALDFWHASCQIWANMDSYPASVWKDEILHPYLHSMDILEPLYALFNDVFLGAVFGARFCRFNFFFCSMGSTPSMVKKRVRGLLASCTATDARFLPPTISSYVIKVCIYIYLYMSHTYTCMCINIYIYIYAFFGSFTYAHIYIYI